MIPISRGARVWLVTGHTDMRKGIDGLALIVQETGSCDPRESEDSRARLSPIALRAEGSRRDAPRYSASIDRDAH